MEEEDTVSAFRYRWKATAHVPTGINFVEPRLVYPCTLRVNSEEVGAVI